MIKFYCSLVFVTFFALLFSSCEVYNPEETIPSYIHIDKINLTTSTTPVDQGSNSSKITDAWVYIDDQSVGAFELPATFPVLYEGNHKITIKAGIKVSGIARARAIYPFYESYTQNFNLVKDSIINISPTVNYFSSTAFNWLEGFEDGGIKIEKTLRSDTIIEKTSDAGNVFEGTYSGVITLDNNRGFYEGQSIKDFIIPLGNTVFLEMNYKTNNIFTVGVIAQYANNSSMNDILVINRSGEWNKIYINLTDRIRYLYDTNNPPTYKIFFQATKETDVSQAKIFIDNLKLLY
ncbi:MAG: hypothetical protein HXX09_07345 [Bacteroidetes bacterium]|nr:hypothetical protein [Bacteroidota bacterium]